LTIQFLVIMVPVVLGMMGFAVDLGRIYLVRGELNQAASAMAIAAASKLNGTIAATTNATTAAQATLDDSLSDANRYNFGSLVVGQGNALLTSAVQQPAYFQNVSDAFASLGQSGAGGSADGTTAHHVAVNLAADAPLTFWALLSLGQSRKTSIAAAAIAGISAPVCTACGIEPFAVAAVDTTLADTVNFGFVPGQLYTLGYMCTGAAPALLAGTTAPRIPYLIIDRYNTSLSFTEDQQLFRVGAQGLIPSTTPALACSIINTTENLWASATPQACGAATPNVSVQNAMCGLSQRMTDSTQISACATSVSDLGDLAAVYTQDTDTLSETDYTTYIGTNKRVLTLPVVNALSTTPGTMLVVGFRQFLLEPTTTSTASPQANVPTDGDGRFVAMYLGSVAPVKQGNLSAVGMNISCGISTGPGKVVLFQ
jgi:Flp pilus assembly protein TadG